MGGWGRGENGWWVLEELGEMVSLWVRLSHDSSPNRGLFHLLQKSLDLCWEVGWGPTPFSSFLLPLLLALFHLGEAAPQEHKDDKEKKRHKPPTLQQGHMNKDFWAHSEMHNHAATPAIPGHSQRNKTKAFPYVVKCMWPSYPTTGGKK